MPELRKDPVTGRWVIISAERSSRPTDLPRAGRVSNEGKICPFDAGQEALTPPEVFALRAPGTSPNERGWTLRVVPNRFPALKVEGGLVRKGEGIYDRMTGVGAHEVIIETPDHCLDLANLDSDSFRNVIQAYSERVTDLARDERLKYVLVFKNHGPAAGASLSHSHSQLIATPVVPKLVREELDGSRQYWDFHERCIFCDILRQETQVDSRMVLENEHFIAFEPFAPRFPYETWVLSRRHLGIFSQMNHGEISALAVILQGALQRVNRVLGDPDYNFVIHTVPLRMVGSEYYHFHIEIMPKKTTVAGFEWGSGFFINPVGPEDAAKYLREVA